MILNKCTSHQTSKFIKYINGMNRFFLLILEFCASVQLLHFIFCICPVTIYSCPKCFHHLGHSLGSFHGAWLGSLPRGCRASGILTGSTSGSCLGLMDQLEVLVQPIVKVLGSLWCCFSVFPSPFNGEGGSWRPSIHASTLLFLLFVECGCS